MSSSFMVVPFTLNSDDAVSMKQQFQRAGSAGFAGARVCLASESFVTT